MPASEAPGETWQVYTGPIRLEAGEKLVALAHRLGYQPSEIVTVEAASASAD